MRKSFVVTALGLALFAMPVGAQEVKTIKASGANAAGACAGAFEMFGQYVTRAEGPTSDKLGRISAARDFFADIPVFDKDEVTAAANAYLTFMGNRLQAATTELERNAINDEIRKLADQCYAVAEQRVAEQRRVLQERQGAQPQPLDQQDIVPLPAPQ